MIIYLGSYLTIVLSKAERASLWKHIIILAGGRLDW